MSCLLDHPIDFDVEPNEIRAIGIVQRDIKNLGSFHQMDMDELTRLIDIMYTTINGEHLRVGTVTHGIVLVHIMSPSVEAYLSRLGYAHDHARVEKITELILGWMAQYRILDFDIEDDVRERAEGHEWRLWHVVRGKYFGKFVPAPTEAIGAAGS